MKRLYWLCFVTLFSAAVGCSSSAPPPSSDEQAPGQFTEDQLKNEREIGKPPKS